MDAQNNTIPRYATFLQGNDKMTLLDPDTAKPLLLEHWILKHLSSAGTSQDTVVEVRPHEANESCYQLLRDGQSLLPEHTYLCFVYADTDQETTNKSLFHVALRTPEQLLGLYNDKEKSQYEFRPYTQDAARFRMDILPSTKDTEQLIRNNFNDGRPVLPVKRALKETQPAGSWTFTGSNDTVVIVFVVIIALISVSSLGYIGYLIWMYMNPYPVAKEVTKQAIKRQIGGSERKELVVNSGEGTIGS
jgi:hypothetical protein